MQTTMTTRRDDTLTGTAQGPDRPAAVRVEARKQTRKTKRARVVVFLALVLMVLVVRPASHHARAASLLVAFSDPAATPAVTESRFTFAREGEEVPARLYAPAGVASAPGVVLVHGVHRGGIDEVRLERFARALAGAGVMTITPAPASARAKRSRRTSSMPPRWTP